MKLLALEEWGGRAGARKVGELAVEDADVKRSYWQTPQESEGMFRDGKPR